MTVSYSKIKVVPSDSYSIFDLVILQIKPTYCTVFLSMFISFLYIVWATMCPSSEEITVCDTWYISVCVDDCLVCRVIPAIRPHRVANTKCCIDTVVSPDDGHIVARNNVDERNKHIKKNCAPIWLYLQDYTRMDIQQNIKFGNL